MATTKNIVHKILPFGARVRLSSVDMYGYWGRDLHPDVSDIGFLGIVIKNHLETQSDGGTMGRTGEDLPPGRGVRQDDDYPENPDALFEDVMYTVMSPDGRKLECMWFELEEFGSVFSLPSRS
jgi:hypothetical protein